MSSNETESGDLLRTVTPLSKRHRNTEMNAIGLLIFVALLVIMIPLVPVLVLFWIVTKIGSR